MEREKIWFDSHGERCAAWHYPGTNGGCVVMAGGGGVPKEPGTDRFASRFHAAGFSVLAFDYRRIGESEGEPRQVIRVRDQLDDWDAAMPNALRHETLGVILRMPLLALLDILRGAVRLPPLTGPLAGPRGTIAMLSTPDAQHGDRALNPHNRYPDWQQTIAARSVLRIGGCVHPTRPWFASQAAITHRS